MAGGDGGTYDALIDQVFGRFAAVIGMSATTGYNWNDPPDDIKDEVVSVTVSFLLLSQ